MGKINWRLAVERDYTWINRREGTPVTARGKKANLDLAA